MLRQPKFWLFLVVLSHLAMLWSCEQQDEVFSLAGHWEGIVDVAQDSSEVTQVAHMSLIISSDSDVLGEIGDANIEPGATLEKNNFAETDYVINAKISGSLFGFDSLKNAPVRIIVQVKEGVLNGGFSVKVGQNEAKPPSTLTGADMHLKRL